MTRAQGFTFAKVKPEYYTDFIDSFDLNPQTGLLRVISNEQAIIQSIKNLVLTNKFERFYQPLVGSKVQSLNFEMNDPITSQFLQDTILETIQNFEPRAQQVSVLINQDIDNNAINVSVIFSMRNLNQPVTFEFLLPRVR